MLYLYLIVVSGVIDCMLFVLGWMFVGVYMFGGV